MIPFQPLIHVFTKTTSAVLFGMTGGQRLGPIEFGRFPGGEVYLKTDIASEIRRIKPDSVHIHASLSGDMNEFFALMMVVDAIKRCSHVAELDMLNLVYMPYGRQDRFSEDAVNSSLSLKLVTDIINQMGFKRVLIDHPHSNVTTGLINNAAPMIYPKFFAEAVAQVLGDNEAESLVGIISPDAGALKFCEGLVSTLNSAQDTPTSFDLAGIGLKIRDMKTGEITGTQVLNFENSHKHYFIFDDICDGGRTFTELANAIRKIHPGEVKIHLAVSHGIFSKGVEVLLDHLDSVSARTCFLTEGRPSTFYTRNK